MNAGPIGQPLPRVEGPVKVTGRARYAAEFDPPGVAYATLVQSTVPRGSLARIDVGDAESEPGVLRVLTHLNAPRLPYREHRGSSDPDCGERLHVLQDERIQFFGQPVALVVAESLEQARYAATRLRIEYAALPAALELEIDRAVLPDNCRTPCSDFASDGGRGDADAALRAAEVRVDHAYVIERQNHHPIEPHATVASWEDERLTLWSKSQFVSSERDEIAAIFGIPSENVRVLSPFVGGAFGSALRSWPHVTLAAMAARELGRPVKVVLERGQMAALTGYRPRSQQRIALGAGRDGRLAAIVHEALHETSRYEQYVEDIVDVSGYLYSCPDVRTRYRLVPLDVSTPTYMRAPGESSGMFALECAMDELAVELGIDPVELRMRNEPERDESSGRPFSSRSLRECFRIGAQRFGWARRDPRPGSMRDGALSIGWGTAASTYPAFGGRAEARVCLRADGTADVEAATSDMGPGTCTSMTQVAAAALGLPIENVRFRLGDSDLPTTPPQGGSMTMASVGSAVQAACESARAQALRLAVPADAADAVDAAGGRLYAGILRRAGRDVIEAHGEYRPEKEQRFSKHAFGAVFAEVAVDAELGEVRVRRLVGVYGAGRIVNPRTARSQCIGGMVGGIGMALMEGTHLDPRDGRIVGATLAEYLLPVNLDVRELDVTLLAESDPHVNPLGVKGIAELSLVGVAPAIANAVHHATGRRIRSLPIALESLL